MARPRSWPTWWCSSARNGPASSPAKPSWWTAPPRGPSSEASHMAVTQAPDATDVVLAARGLTKMYGGFRAVDGVDMDVSRNAIHALVGPNGAGKTTLINM